MSSPPPCLWTNNCAYDDDADICPCDDDDITPEPRPIEDVPTGSYL